MVFDYLVTLKKSDDRLADQISQLLYTFSLLVFGWFYYRNPVNFFYPIVCLALLLWWAYALLKKNKDGKVYFRAGLLICAAGWFLGTEPNLWMGVLYVAAALLEKQVKFPKEIGFTPEAITFNSLPRRTLKWSDVSNVLIKDGLITIDQKNNKLYQKEIEGYVTPDVETEFNEFARKQLITSPD